MNQDNIEQLLRKAPHMTPPNELLKQIQEDIRLPRQRTQAVDTSPQPWFRRWIPALSFCSVLAGCVVLIGWQWDQIATLKQENGTLAAQTSSQAGDSNQSQALPGNDLETLRKESAELENLRAEVARLRAQIGNLDDLLAENKQLISQLSSRSGGSEGPELAEARARAESIRCVNNLKNIGLAARIFASDHQDAFPSGFLAMKNELGTPKILHCSSDIAKSAATDWAEFSASNLTYEWMSSNLKVDDDTSTVLVRCPIHGHITLLDGSVQMNPEQRGAKIIAKDGRMVLTPASP